MSEIIDKQTKAHSEKPLAYKNNINNYKKQAKFEQKFFLQGNKKENTFYKAYANELNKVKKSIKKYILQTTNFRKKFNPK